MKKEGINNFFNSRGGEVNKILSFIIDFVVRIVIFLSNFIEDLGAVYSNLKSIVLKMIEYSNPLVVRDYRTQMLK